MTKSSEFSRWFKSKFRLLNSISFWLPLALKRYITVISFFSSDQIAHPVCTTFCALCTFTKSPLYLILNASKASNMKYKTIAKQKGPLYTFFGFTRLSPPLFMLCETFFEIFQCSKGSLLIFKKISN